MDDRQLDALQRQIDDLRERTDAASKFGNKLVGGLLVLGVVLGGMQWFVVRQIGMTDETRAQALTLERRVIVLEVEQRYRNHRLPVPDDKEKP